MIISESNQSEVIGVDKETTIDMTIDDSNKKLLMMILSQGLYSDGIGSLIRELTTNALDAQREAKNNEPIRVSLIKENGKFVFSVKDSGVGLSPDRIENVFSKYCSSTKRDSEDQLGFFGLGSKAPLAYTDSFNIISKFEGVEYKYMMFKGEEGTQLSLMDMNDTTESNGVTIEVTLKEDDDYEVFLEKMKRQLAYFEGVFFITEFDDITNDFKIIKNETWKYSELNQDKFLHLAMDNVYYPLDFEKLGMEPVAIPIALNLSLKEGIVPTPNREQILYTPQTKTLIMSKVRILADTLITKWNTIAPEAIDLFTAERLYNSHGTIPLWEENPEDPLNGKSINIKIDKKIEKYSNIPMIHVSMPIYPHLPLKRMIETKGTMFHEYKIVSRITSVRYSTKIEEWESVVNSVNRKIILLKDGESLSKSNIEYIKWSGISYDIVRVRHPRKLGTMHSYNTSTDNYYGLLQLRNKPRDIWRIMINEYCSMVKSYTDKWYTLKDVEPTQEFLDWRKSNRKSSTRRNILKEEVTLGIARTKEVYDRNNKPVYDKMVFKIEDLSKLGKVNKALSGIYIYSTEDRWEELDPYFQIGQMMYRDAYYTFLDGKKEKQKRDYKYQRLNVAILSERNYKKIKNLDIPNWINLDNVLVKKNRVLSQYLTAFIMKEFMSVADVAALFTKSYFVSLLDKQTYFSINRFNGYIQRDWSYKKNVPNGLMYRLLTTYVNNKWLDYDILSDAQYVNKHYADMTFLWAINIESEHNYYPWGYDKSNPIVNKDMDKGLEVKIARMLYNKFAVTNFHENQKKDFNDFISSVVAKFAPTPEVLEEEKEEIEENYEEDDEDSTNEDQSVKVLDLVSDDNF